jgi:hypothetical protein
MRVNVCLDGFRRSNRKLASRKARPLRLTLLRALLIVLAAGLVALPSHLVKAELSFAVAQRAPAQPGAATLSCPDAKANQPRRRGDCLSTSPSPSGDAPGMQPLGTQSPAATITVDRLDDTAAASACTAAGNDCSLRGAFAFADANPGTTINVPAGTYLLTIDELQLGSATNTNTTILGASPLTTIIQQTLPNRRVLDINPDLAANVVVTISSVKITGGNNPSDHFHGGGIIAGGPTNILNVASCIIDGNSDAGNPAENPPLAFGGGIEYSGGGVLHIDNSVISNNTAANAPGNRGSGGGIDYAMSNNAGRNTGGLLIENSIITNNHAVVGGGGVNIDIASTATPTPVVSITNNTFTSNTATDNSGSGAGFGGAIQSIGRTPITVNFNRILGNTATGGGSGVFQATGTVGTINATENWWGCNSGPNNAGCDGVGGLVANITTNPRLFLTHTANPNPIVTGQATTLTASFLADSANTNLTLANLSRVIGLPITFNNPVRGGLSGAQTSIQASGTATATFTASAAGAGSTNATVDNAVVTASITVNKANTTVAITSDTPDPTVVGQNYTVNAGVSVVAPGSGVPTGTITISDGTNTGTITLPATSCTMPSTSAGAKTLTATYNGDANFNASAPSAGVSHTVNKAGTTTTITADTPDPSNVGQNITVTVTLAVNAPGSGTATGNITISDGVSSSTTTVANGSCTFALTTSGNRTLTATYDGDGNFNGSTSAGVPHVVNTPTAIDLIAFTASTYDTGTLIEWRTGFESENLGFRIYRDEAGKRTVINSQLVAGSALVAGSTLGADYAWWDGEAVNSKHAAYWLEDIDLKNGSSWHGPFYPRSIGGKAPTRSQAATLSERAAGSVQVDSSRPVEPTASLTSTQNEQLDLQSSSASQPAIKISVRREGWYRVSQPELVAAGLDPRGDPELLQLFADGREQPMLVSTGNGGRFDELSAIEFYGIGLDTPASDVRTYWLVWGKRAGLRVQQIKTEGAPSSARSFTSTVERRDRIIYFSGLLNGERENFFGAVIASQPVDLALNLPHLSQASENPAEIEVSLQGVTHQSHRVLIQLNGDSLDELNFAGQDKGVARFTVPHTLLSEGANTVRLIAQNGSGDVSLVEAIRISYQHTLLADADALTVTATGGQSVHIGGFTSKAIRVFDVTDAQTVEELFGEISEQGDGYGVTVAPQNSGERRLLVIGGAQTRKPEQVSANQPSNWRDRKNAADFVIITRRDLFTALAPLQALRELQGYKVALIDIEDIFDEFNFGNGSAQAVKDLLLYATSNWKVKPRFVLLAGDATFDPRNYLGFGAGNLVPTKLVDTSLMETASDDWFADFNDDGLAEIAVGRLPVRSAEEAALVVDKIIGYESARPSEELTLVADASDGYNFAAASSALGALVPPALRVNQIDRGSLDAVTAKTRLLAAIDRGQKVVNYAGHGSMGQWRGNLLNSDDAAGMKNRERLSLFVMMTCLNGYYHDVLSDSLGESLLKAEHGGAVAVWASSGMTLPDEQAAMNQALYRILFSLGEGSVKDANDRLTLGDALQRAKAAVANQDVRKTWVLLGDPTMRIK